MKRLHEYETIKGNGHIPPLTKTRMLSCLEKEMEKLGKEAKKE